MMAIRVTDGLVPLDETEVQRFLNSLSVSIAKAEAFRLEATASELRNWLDSIQSEHEAGNDVSVPHGLYLMALQH